MSYNFGLLNGQRRLGDIVVSIADRGPCPVCGHPTGDCRGDAPPPTHIWGLGTIPSMADSQTVLVEEDIYEERQITPFTKARVLVAKKGKHVPLDKARELGLL